MSLEFMAVDDSSSARVEFTIINWEDIAAGCSQVIILVPGLTDSEVYLANGTDPTAFPQNAVTRGGDLSSIVVDTKWVRDFEGLLAFRWVEALRAVSYDKLGLLLSLSGYVGGEYDEGNKVQHFWVEVQTPSGYSMESSSLSPYRFRLLDDRSLYYFDIDTTRDFFLIMENADKSRSRDYSLVLMSTLLGVGLSMFVGSLVSRFDARIKARPT